MSIAYCLLLAVLALASIGFQSMYQIRNKQYKELWAQLTVISVAIVAGAVAILRLSIPSAAELIVRAVPWG